MAFYRVKKNKQWIVKALDRGTGRTVAWVIGGRDAATFQRLYDKVKHLTECVFFTDDWDAFAKVLPSERHVVGKEHTTAVEQDNSNTRHHLGRMTRRTKVVSKKVEMVDANVKALACSYRPRHISGISSRILIYLYVNTIGLICANKMSTPPGGYAVFLRASMENLTISGY